jgi:two-component system heavy metal sensor histidine kinase CusS
MFYSAFLLIHSTLHSSLSKEENDFIYSRLHAIRAIIQEKPDYLHIIKQDIDWEGKYTAFPEYYLRIIDESGHMLIETPGMSKTIPVEWVPSPPTIIAHGNKDIIRQSQNGRYFLLKGDSVDTPSDTAKKVTIQLALDVTSEETIDEENHKIVITLLVIGVFIFAVIGGGIIRRVLAPLEEMIKVSEGITVKKISERIDFTNWPKEITRLAISFNCMLDRLEDAFTRLSQCASNMAHEIRTPINNFMGEAEVALSQERTPEEYRKVLESGVEECERLSRLINSLLFLARAENPTNSIQYSLFDPLEEIKDLLSFYMPQVKGKEAELTCHGNGLLNGDPLLFRRAISNLLTNALNYSKKGVKIDISVRPVEDGYFEIIVGDTGYGIEKEDLSRIFDRFYRVDDSHSKNPEGSGLGLSIVRAIMELHGGSVNIESTPGEGTTVTLHFPTKPPIELKDERQRI